MKKSLLLLRIFVVLLFFFLISSNKVSKIAYAVTSNWNPGCGSDTNITFTVNDSVATGSNNTGTQTFTLANTTILQGKTFYIRIYPVLGTPGDIKVVSITIPANSTQVTTTASLSPGDYETDVNTENLGSVSNIPCTISLPFKIVNSTPTPTPTTDPNSGLLTGCEGLGTFKATANSDDPTKGVTLTVTNSTTQIKGKTLYIWIHSAERTITTAYPITIDDLAKTTVTVQGNFQKGEAYIADIGNQAALGVNRRSCADDSFSFTPPTIAVPPPATTTQVEIPDLAERINTIVTYSMGIGGLIAFLLIVFGGFQIILSGGNPERVKAGKEMITSAIAGLVLIIFAVFILKLIGVDILKIPGFGG